MTITCRGKCHPDDYNYNDVHLHIRRHRVRGLPTKDDTLCRDGAYHLRWTDDLGEVTCKKCLAKLAEGELTDVAD